MVDPKEGSIAGGDLSGIDPRFQEGQPNPTLSRKRRWGKRWPMDTGRDSPCRRYFGDGVGLGLASPVGRA